MPSDLRPLHASDLPGVLALNQANVPEVGPLDEARLRAIVDECTLALVVAAASDPSGIAGDVDAVVLVLGPGAAYDSPNYRWFAERYDDFRYVDRIAVADHAHRRGLGRRLYAEVFDHARAGGAPVVTAEVNLEPPNPVSLAFHAAAGFVEVGQQDTYGGSVRVSLLAAPVSS